MTKKQKEFLRNAKITVVIGAMVFLATGLTSIGSDIDRKLDPVIVTQTEAAISAEEPHASVMPAAVVRNETTEEPNPTEQPIVYAYNFNDEESNLLCKIAMAEAGNQDVDGKALVMLVVLNRAFGNNKFPNTIKDVIYQPRQFSPVYDGSFEYVTPSEECYQALEMVKTGWDESQGATYFESKSNSTWHKDNLEFLFQHGAHYFYTERN